jgi:dynein heavy chain
MFGLHPNAEIGYLTAAGEVLFESILQIQGGAGGGGGSESEAVGAIIKDFIDKLYPEFNMHEVKEKGKKGEDADPDPFWIVCLQEIERMNLLIFTIKLSLVEL